ncbi:uncharacterized protein CLAFUR5_04612 [Fulvia fulva]|uniref:Uncharacterized protein n=1 Tax=Passalora fulva TaxID=5499 RepID=A0A9Q8LEN7_PASFU|nr:uncharacterized protein CLAFUR5_04612 [Fulvia fulva]KAK4628571.1 hypothetical protein CLAFUR0_04641 [Fulvia fulva]UJO16009.1 hypothetical protein CLAFUR5_04612 [Fulvia fulva]WPV28112.1 hypothetical protein CLAFUW7_04645 [Fulvia fulva]
MLVHRISKAMADGFSWLSGQKSLGGALTSPAGFDWDTIEAHKHFVWQPCFRDFECARLQVPMDWQGTTFEADRTVEIAVIKVEATVPVTDPTYGGAVVLNPGGPGGSGVDEILNGGHHVRTILSAGAHADRDSAKNFDIIGFDPRAINNTRPILSCFPDHTTAAAHNIAEETYGWFNTSNIAFDNLWASKRAVAEGCSRRANSDGLAKHISTAAVARDVVEIFERHGQWRAKEAERLCLLKPQACRALRLTRRENVRAMPLAKKWCSTGAFPMAP